MRTTRISDKIMSISSIELRGMWYDLYDEKGKKYCTLPSHIGDLLGFGANFFVIGRGSWYDLYDEKGRRYKSLPSHIGEFISVNSGGFSVKRGSWIDLYNQEGKKINTRPIK